MKKMAYYLSLALVTILFGSQVLIWADSVGITVKPNHVELNGTIEYNPSYASMNFYTTSQPTFFNLSTTSFQTIRPWSTKASFSNISADISSGTIKFKADSHGFYKVTIRTSFKATEGSTIYLQTIKNGTTIINKTLRQMTSGPEFNVAFANFSGSGSYGSSTDSISNMNSADGIYYHITEGSATPGILLTLTFSGIDSPKAIYCQNCLYSSGVTTHAVGAKIYNAKFNRYTGLTSKTYVNGTEDDFPNNNINPNLDASSVYYRSFNIPLPYKDYVNSSGQVKFRLRHSDNGSNTHNMYLDKVALRSSLNHFYIEHTEIASFNDGDILQMRISSDSPRTV